MACRSGWVPLPPQRRGALPPIPDILPDLPKDELPAKPDWASSIDDILLRDSSILAPSAEVPAGVLPGPQEASDEGSDSCSQIASSLDEASATCDSDDAEASLLMLSEAQNEESFFG